MDWSDVAETVGKIAPAAGGALYGPLGAAVGAVIADKLGVEQSPQAVQQAVNADPEAAVKLREVEAGVTRGLIEQKAAVIKSEAQGESWLQRNWRPMLMVWFAVLVGGYWFGLTPDNLSEATVLSLFDIVQLGVGGYIGGRSVEKVTRTLAGTSFMDAVKAKVRQ